MSHDFETELRSVFLDEASQLLSEAEQCFLQLEESAKDPSLIEKIFRLAHNLKGSANAVGFLSLGEFTHEFESYLLRIKSGAIVVDASSIDLLLRCNDQLIMMVTVLRSEPTKVFDHGSLLDELKNPQAAAAAAPAAPAPAVPAPAPEAPAIEGFHVFEDQPPAKEEAPVVVSKAKTRTPPPAAADESIRVSLERIEKLVNLVGELVILQTVLKEQAQATTSGLLRKTVHQMGKVTKDVQDLSMSLRMVPLKPVFQKMQRIVRDTSATLGKKVNLVLVGEDTEVDKTVLEKLSDPLVHLIRNAVDHGIESGEARVANGKSETGTVTLSAKHQSSNLVIEIRDDGAGLNAEKLKAKAIEKGILKPTTSLTDAEAYNLIFASGFSTKAVVTDVSGRGVGMDVVKTNIEQIQGEILVDTAIGAGTTFTIKLPLTLAIIDGMTAVCGDDRYVIPLTHIYETAKPTPQDVHLATGLGEVYTLRGENLPLFRLSHLLGRKCGANLATEGIAIVVRAAAKPFAVLVDDIISQSQIVIKQLGPEHRDLRGFSGSAILGDGRAALILELPELVARFKGASVSTGTRRTAA